MPSGGIWGTRCSAGLGRIHVVARTVAVLVVHARAGGMVLSIPLSVFTSRRNLGARARKMGLFLTPEEIGAAAGTGHASGEHESHEMTEDTSPRRPTRGWRSGA